MCFPVLFGAAASAGAISAQTAGALTIGASVASAASTLYAQFASVRAAQEAMNQNARNANIDAGNKYRALAVRQLQEEEAAGQEIERLSREALSAEATAALAGVEAGAGGSSLREKVGSFRAAGLAYATSVATNLANTRAAIQQEMGTASQEAAVRINSFRPEYSRPNWLQAGLTVLGGYLGASEFRAPQGAASLYGSGDASAGFAGYKGVMPLRTVRG